MDITPIINNYEIVKLFKLGEINIYKHSNGFYYADFSINGERSRVTTNEKIKVDAKSRLSLIIATRLLELGYISPKEKQVYHNISIEQAFREAFNHNCASEKTRDAYDGYIKQFFDWLNIYPETAAYKQRKLNNKKLINWIDLKPFHIQDYLSYLMERKLSQSTINKYLLVIKITSKFMFKNNKLLYEHITEDIKTPKISQTKTNNFPYKKIPELLEYAYKTDALTFISISLQALCGLRRLEAENLQDIDINFEKKTIMIHPTKHHSKMKNEFSEREIPVCDLVLTILKNHLRKGYILCNLNGSAPINNRNLGESISNVFNLMIKDGIIDKRYEPRRLRGTFEDLCRNLNVQPYRANKYCGRSPESVQEKNYTDISMEELRTIPEVINSWILPLVKKHVLNLAKYKIFKIPENTKNKG